MISERIKSKRKLLKLTQVELARRVTVTQASVSKWEAGRDEPKGKNLSALAKALKVNSEWILNGRGDALPATQEQASVTGTEYLPQAIISAYDRPNLIRYLKGEHATAFKEISAINTSGLYAGSVFAFREDMDGMSPLIFKGDCVHIKADMPIKAGANSMFWVNGTPLIGSIRMSPAGMMLKFVSDDSGWEDIQVKSNDYIGRVIAVEAKWLQDQIAT